MFNFGSKRRQATTIAAALGVLAFGGVLASAATLGTVSGNTLGVGVAAVGSCDSDGMSVSYSNTFDDATGTYQVTGVTIGDINVRSGNLCRKAPRRDAERRRRSGNRHRIAYRRWPDPERDDHRQRQRRSVVGVAIVIADN